MDEPSSPCPAYAHYASQRPLPSTTTVGYHGGNGWGLPASDCRGPVRSFLTDDFSHLVNDVMDSSGIDLSNLNSSDDTRLAPKIPLLGQEEKEEDREKERQLMSATFVTSGRHDVSGLSHADEDSETSSFLRMSSPGSTNSDTSMASESALCEEDLVTGCAEADAQPGGRRTSGYDQLSSDVPLYSDTSSEPSSCDDFHGHGDEADIQKVANSDTGDVISTFATNYALVAEDRQMSDSVVLSSPMYTLSDSSLEEFNQDHRGPTRFRRSLNRLENSDAAHATPSTSAVAEESRLSGSFELQPHMYSFSDASSAVSDTDTDVHGGGTSLQQFFNYPANSDTNSSLEEFDQDHSIPTRFRRSMNRLENSDAAHATQSTSAMAEENQLSGSVSLSPHMYSSSDASSMVSDPDTHVHDGETSFRRSFYCPENSDPHPVKSVPAMAEENQLSGSVVMSSHTCTSSDSFLASSDHGKAICLRQSSSVPESSDPGPVASTSARESQHSSSVLLSSHMYTFSDVSTAVSDHGKANGLQQISFAQNSDRGPVASTSARESQHSGSVLLSSDMYTFSDASIAVSDHDKQDHNRAINLRQKSSGLKNNGTNPVKSASTAAAATSIRNSHHLRSTRSEDASFAQRESVTEEMLIPVKRVYAEHTVFSTAPARQLELPPSPLLSRPDVCSEHWNTSVWKLYNRHKMVAATSTAHLPPSARDSKEPVARRYSKEPAEHRSSALDRPLPSGREAQPKLAPSTSRNRAAGDRRGLAGCACPEPFANSSLSSEWISWTWSEEQWSRHFIGMARRSGGRSEKKSLLQRLKRAFTRCCREESSDVSISTSNLSAVVSSSTGPTEDSRIGSSLSTGSDRHPCAHDRRETTRTRTRLSFGSESETDDFPAFIDLSGPDMRKITKQLQEDKSVTALLQKEAEIALKLIEFLSQPEQSVFYKMSSKNREQMERLATACFVKAVISQRGITLTKTLVSRVPVARDILWLRSF